MSRNKKSLVRIIVATLACVVCIVLQNTTALHLHALIALFVCCYLIVGYDVVWGALRNILHGRLFDEKFLMTIATVGAFFIGEYADAVAVMILYQIGELFQRYAVGKSRKSIADLMDIVPEQATLVLDDKEVDVHPSEVAIGQTIVVKAGDKIPLDGVVCSGSARLDTSAITGESQPKRIVEGQTVTGGCVNLDGVLYIITTSAYENTTVAKILDLVQNATSQKSPAENFITKFSRYYTPVVVIFALLLGVIPPIFDGLWTIWLRRAMMFLFVSCPCALVISVPLGFFGGIASASKHGILIKGSNYLELLAKCNVVAFDKTGTLTHGNFEVTYVYPADKAQHVLQTACIAEQYSNHPIAQSICKKATADTKAVVREIAGKGLRATTANSVILCGNAQLMQQFDVQYTPATQNGTVVYVAQNEKFVGYVVIADQLKEDAKQAVENLRKDGCKTVMLTGDNANTAQEIANQAGVEQFYAQLLPTDKVDYVQKLQKQSKVAFVGDGINDAPVLATADVGIAMGAMGSDVAIEAADVVLMQDNPTAIVTAKRIAKRTLSIVKQNIAFSLIVKFAVLVLSAVGVLDKTSFGLIIAILADVGVCVVAILNSMRTMLVNKTKGSK